MVWTRGGTFLTPVEAQARYGFNANTHSSSASKNVYLPRGETMGDGRESVGTHTTGLKG